MRERRDSVVLATCDWNDFNHRLGAGRACEPPITRKEHCVERFRERDVDSVVGTEVVMKLPHTIEQWLVRVSLKVQCSKIGQGRNRFGGVEVPVSDVSSQRLCDLYIGEVRDVETGGGVGDSRSDAPTPRRL